MQPSITCNNYRNVHFVTIDAIRGRANVDRQRLQPDVGVVQCLLKMSVAGCTWCRPACKSIVDALLPGEKPHDPAFHTPAAAYDSQGQERLSLGSRMYRLEPYSRRGILAEQAPGLLPSPRSLQLTASTEVTVTAVP